jgi:hypothetical protein
MLPIEEGDIDDVDPKFDIFEIASPTKWIPERFRVNQIKAELLPEFDLENPEDPKIGSVSDQYPTSKFPYLNTSFHSGDIASFVVNLSHEELTGQQEYNPEYDGYEFNQDIFTQPDFQILLSRLTFGPSYSSKVNLATLKPWHRVVYPNVDPQKLQPFLAYHPLDIVKKTLEHTTQMAKSSIRYPLQRHFKARNPFSNVHRHDIYRSNIC